MSTRVVNEYLSIGGNRHTAASAWSTSSGALAFGADHNVAIWHPSNGKYTGIQDLLNGHHDKVTAIAFLDNGEVSGGHNLISGSADGKLIIWEAASEGWQPISHAEAHAGAVNIIACLSSSNLFATGGADAQLKIWKISNHQVQLVASVAPKHRIIPLALALGAFSDVGMDQGFFMAVGGTRNDIQVYVIKFQQEETTIELQALLKGHEGWIRSLALQSGSGRELLLASASADKYVRLWKFCPTEALAPIQPPHQQPQIEYEESLQARAQTLSIGKIICSITFEALLLGHEDWVYSAAWSPRLGSNQLLTASADGTLSIWEPDSASGIWISTSKLGEISGQKGATTATGSAGGFWNALWSPEGDVVTCLGRTGSWRVWKYSEETEFWEQIAGISGHTASANGLTWATNGQYVLSTSSDQTTRLHAQWVSNNHKSWHEFSRPQIHGYDLNCLTATSDHQFVSGADEKLLRVFNEPRDIARMLQNLCLIDQPVGEDLPDMAAIPVLGLSNKAMGEEDESFTEVGGRRDQDFVAPSVLESSLANVVEPPNEDVLARHTLWPEHEKLYGHGYEISECAASGKYLATACKASSTDHAVIRVYDTTSWTEIKPALQAHSLTATRLTWSKSLQPYLLSVGRDRKWAIFSLRKTSGEFALLQSNGKAHARMILDAAWSPMEDQLFFATAGRDKSVRIWCSAQPKANSEDEVANHESLDFAELLSIKRDTSVTAISFTSSHEKRFTVLAMGEEDGKLSLHVFDTAQRLSLVRSVDLPSDQCPSKAISRLAWREVPSHDKSDQSLAQLAIAAADGSVRILGIDVEALCVSQS